MTDYKIVCTDQEPISQPKTHAHIIAVGIDTNNDNIADTRATKSEVIADIKNGTHRYYTIGARTGIKAFVQVAPCSICRYEIIRSTPDATTDNNLDYIRRCNWKS